MPVDSETYAYDVMRGDMPFSRMSIVGADAWFDEEGAGKYEIKEQSIKTYADEILVLLRITDEEMQEEHIQRFSNRA